jgi:hypothetical protein
MQEVVDQRKVLNETGRTKLARVTTPVVKVNDRGRGEDDNTLLVKGFSPMIYVIIRWLCGFDPRICNAKHFTI